MIPYFLTSSDMHTNYAAYTHNYASQAAHTKPTSTNAVLLPNLPVPFAQHLLQPLPAEAHWHHLPWDEEFHIKHHRENLRKLDDLLSQLARIAYGR